MYYICIESNGALYSMPFNLFDALAADNCTTIPWTWSLCIFLPRENNTCTYQFVEDEFRDRRSLLGLSLFQKAWITIQGRQKLGTGPVQCERIAHWAKKWACRLAKSLLF